MEFTFELNFWLILQLLILPVLLPMLVGLVTTRVTSSGRKAILLLALSVITSFLTELLNAYEAGQESFDLGLALLTTIVTFVFGVGIHYGFLKPTGTTHKLQSVGRKEDHNLAA